MGYLQAVAELNRNRSGQHSGETSTFISTFVGQFGIKVGTLSSVGATFFTPTLDTFAKVRATIRRRRSLKCTKEEDGKAELSPFCPFKGLLMHSGLIDHWKKTRSRDHASVVIKKTLSPGLKKKKHKYT